MEAQKDSEHGLQKDGLKSRLQEMLAMWIYLDKLLILCTSVFSFIKWVNNPYLQGLLFGWKEYLKPSRMLTHGNEFFILILLFYTITPNIRKSKWIIFCLLGHSHFYPIHSNWKSLIFGDIRRKLLLIFSEFWSNKSRKSLLTIVSYSKVM